MSSRTWDNIEQVEQAEASSLLKRARIEDSRWLIATLSAAFIAGFVGRFLYLWIDGRPFWERWWLPVLQIPVSAALIAWWLLVRTPVPAAYLEGDERAMARESLASGSPVVDADLAGVIVHTGRRMFAARWFYRAGIAAGAGACYLDDRARVVLPLIFLAWLVTEVGHRRIAAAVSINTRVLRGRGDWRLRESNTD